MPDTLNNNKQRPKYSALSILLSLLLLAFCSAGQASQAELSPIVVEALEQQFPLQDHLYVFEDRSQILGINDIVSLEEEQWQRVEQRVPSFGFNANPHWFAFEVQNKLKLDVGLYLHVDFSALDHVEVFVFTDGKPRQSYMSGDRYPFYERSVNYPSFVFPVDIDSSSRTRIVIKVQTEGSVLVPISLWRKDAFLDQKQQEIMLYGMVGGAFLVLAIYNLFLFVSVRDRSYLYYGLFTLSYLGLTMSLEGYAYQWVWPEFPHIQQRSILIFGGLSSLFLILFTKHFLPISGDSRMRKWIRALIVLGCLNLVSINFLPYAWAATLQSVIGFIAVLAAAFVSLVLSARSQALARLFLAAWTLFFVGVMSSILSNVGLIQHTNFTEYSSILGAIIGLMMLSFALGYRIRAEINEKQAAKQEAMEHLERFRSLYENSVEGIFLLDDRFNVLQANPRFYELSHRSAESELDLNFLDFFTNYNRRSDFAQQLRSGNEVRNFEIMLNTPDQTAEHPIWISTSLKPVVDGNDNKARYEGSLMDVSEVKQFEAKLKDLALHDSLTGLLRRRSFESSCRDLLHNVAHSKSSGLIYIDIDQFRVINELCGHTAGDTLLKNVAKVISTTLGAFGTPYRLSRIAADEFCALVIDSNQQELTDCAERIREAIESYFFHWDSQQYHVECSIGLLVIESKHSGIADLLNRANKCCDTAKRAGRNRVYVELEQEESEHDERMHMAWINTIREATTKDHFQLQVQAIETIDALASPNGSKARSIPAHFEVLLRLNLPDDAGVSPDLFLPSAERFKLMPLIDRWVISKFFDWCDRHIDQVAQMDLASINLSMQSIGDPQFRSWLHDQFQARQLPPEKVCLEITESVAITSAQDTRNFIDHFRQLGCKFALDDFGTGFSSYANLKSIGVNFVKIDGVFIHNIVNNPVDYTMVKSICEIAQAMEIKTIAEFVENQETVNTLRALGVDMVQGYFIHEPEPLSDTNSD